MLGFTHKLEDGLLIMEIEKMDMDQAKEAVKVYKNALEDPSMKKKAFSLLEKKQNF